MPDELSPAVAQLYRAYVDELGAAIDSLHPWWRAELRPRWPAGIGSHPRVLAIYREHHRRFAALAQPSASGPEPRFDDDALWGSEAEGEPEALIPIAPERLLVDRLQVEAPALFAVMIPLILKPLSTPLEPKPSLRALEVLEADPRHARGFHFEHRHGVQRGVERLLAAPNDLRPAAIREVPFVDASEFHRLAHHAYARALERALEEAEAWWTRELGQREARGASGEDALADLYRAHPCGPVSHPRVLGVIQAFWILCEEINTVFAAKTRRVAPEQVLLGWLLDGHHETWVEILSAMPYWPIGLDAAGAWV
jgi:hypothetical protein